MSDSAIPEPDRLAEILPWLRHEQASWDDNFGPGGGDTFRRAADEIERLIAEISKLRDEVARLKGDIQ